MIPKEIHGYSKPLLIDWLRNKAGSSNPAYFKANHNGGLKLQQVPDEYAELLLLLKSKKIEKYLELGIGNGGSFALTTAYLKDTLEYAVAVDNLAYGALIGQNEVEVLNYIEHAKSHTGEAIVGFVKKSTDQYFESIQKQELFFDAIFIDADHSYEAAKKDYNNALNHITKGGLIIFHDINSAACPGIVKLWGEVKQGRKNWEFVSSYTCGIGVIEI